MKKSSKNKKDNCVKEAQKISSFFKKKINRDEDDDFQTKLPAQNEATTSNSKSQNIDIKKHFKTDLNLVSTPLSKSPTTVNRTTKQLNAGSATVTKLTNKTEKDEIKITSKTKNDSLKNNAPKTDLHACSIPLPKSPKMVNRTTKKLNADPVTVTTGTNKTEKGHIKQISKTRDDTLKNNEPNIDSNDFSENKLQIFKKKHSNLLDNNFKSIKQKEFEKKTSNIVKETFGQRETDTEQKKIKNLSKLDSNKKSDCNSEDLNLLEEQIFNEIRNEVDSNVKIIKKSAKIFNKPDVTTNNLKKLETDPKQNIVNHDKTEALYLLNDKIKNETYENTDSTKKHRKFGKSMELKDLQMNNTSLDMLECEILEEIRLEDEKQSAQKLKDAGIETNLKSVNTPTVSKIDGKNLTRKKSFQLTQESDYFSISSLNTSHNESFSENLADLIDYDSDSTPNVIHTKVTAEIHPEPTNLPRDCLHDITNIEPAVLKKTDKSEECQSKKRKADVSLPEIIPGTPESEIKSRNRCSDKIKKFFNPKVEDVPGLVVQPIKKQKLFQSNEEKKIIKLSDINEKEFVKLHSETYNDSVLEVVTIDDSFTESSQKITKDHDAVFTLNSTSKKQQSVTSMSLFSQIENDANHAEIHCTPQNELKMDNIKQQFLVQNKPSSPKKTPPKLDQSVISTTDFIVSPSKNMSPSKSMIKKTPTKIMSPSKWSPLFTNSKKSPRKKLIDISEINSEKSEDSDSLVAYFKNLPSSSEEKKAIEINDSNYIVTKKNVDDALEKVSEENLDFYFEDSLDPFNQILSITLLDLESWQYCNIVETLRDTYFNLIITVESLTSHDKATCILSGVWTQTRLKKGDKVNLIAAKIDGNIPYLINNDKGFIVYEPDLLIGSTSLVGSLFCRRRGVLSENFKDVEPENQHLVIGSLVHALLQKTLKEKLTTAEEIEKVLLQLLKKKYILQSLYSAEMSLDDIMLQMPLFIYKIQDFVRTYVLDKGERYTHTWNGVIDEIQDIEENIWCSKLGIKGRIDVSVKIHKKRDTQNKIVLPLELKTGRASGSAEHRGQVILYAMMMSELGLEVSSGLLLYLREGKMQEIPARDVEKRDLLILRNELAYYLKQQPKLPNDNKEDSSKSSKSSVIMEENNPLRQLNYGTLPEPINHHVACQKCPYARICTGFLTKDNSYELKDSHPLFNISKDLLQHLEQSHIDYVVHWCSLLHLESTYKSPIKNVKDIWRLAPIKREQLGKSLCYLKLIEPVLENYQGSLHEFKRSPDAPSENLKGLLSSSLMVGAYIIVSTDTRPAVASGHVTKITDNEVHLYLDRNLSERYADKVFHVDTYETQTMLNLNMTFVASLLDDTERAKRLRELIIERQIPKYGQLTKEGTLAANGLVKRLNKNQQRAVLKALSAEDYVCIKGMPGTGKTATIVSLIQMLVDLKKTVLITSHTNSAVDNVCLRLHECGIDFLRLGVESKIHISLKQYLEHEKTAHCTTPQQLKEVYESAQVVASTCFGSGHAALSKRVLDVCVIDESTQVLQSSVIRTLQSCKSFVLIGDPDQLPPVVSNPEAIVRGMNESIFERLSTPQSTVTLTLQYRMNKTITSLANALTYKGQLLCADDSIGYAILRLPKIERIQTLYSSEQWVLEILNPRIEYSVMAVNTGPTWKHFKIEDRIFDNLKVPVQNVQEDQYKTYSNIHEAAIVITIIEALIEGGVQSENIGVIAPYRSQVTLLRKSVSKLHHQGEHPVEVNTVDQYQGRDKDVIIYSCTKSRDTSKTRLKSNFEILEDHRRLTVAITRSKHKIIIIGDFVSLKEYTPFNKLLSVFEPHQTLALVEEQNGFSWEKVLKRAKTYDI